MEQPSISTIQYKDVCIDILRLDTLSTIPNGNKHYKLLYNLKALKNQGKNALLTFGGVFSNHLLATAQAGKTHYYKTIGIVRGDPESISSPTLQACLSLGMKLFFCDRMQYRSIRLALQANHDVDKMVAQLSGIEGLLDWVSPQKDQVYILPEGGTNQLAVEGCTLILKEVKKKYDEYYLPVGTGGTISGIIKTLNDPKKVVGFAAVRDKSLPKQIASYTEFSESDIQINYEYTFGGFGKWNAALIDFINQFATTYHIQLDPIYTGKMMYGIFEKIRAGAYTSSQSRLVIHTGGLQGIKGFNHRFGHLIHT